MSLELPKLIERFSNIIVSVNVTRFEQYGSSLRLRAIMEFTDGSRLGIRESVIGGTKRKYAYHWQDGSGNLIMRWDNAPDWDVKTHPHHKHVGKEKAVDASYERTLEQVLQYISKKSNPPE
jgi:hypothetical protein